ncbi:MAG TPA: hypothetical protein VGX03_06285 [Candidatus Binatia bacterium]|jgi:hypothetical protein|nr:hypothetical protein [Candidatus Binatia bacterium]
MENTRKNTFVWVLAFAFVGLGLVTTALAGPLKSDFALLDEEAGVGDTSVQCGATKASANNPKPVAFTMYITMTNRGDLGGVDGFVRVTYRDLDFVDYAIPANTTVQISLAGGGTPGVDDIIKVSGDGSGGSVLIGQASIILHTDGKPPLATAGGKKAFCTTSPASPAPF